MTKKTGILFIVLILPVFVYLGLKQFGTNHYALPRYIPAIDSTTGEIKMAKRLNPRWNESELDTVFQTLPAFQLINENGKHFHPPRLKEKFMWQVSFLRIVPPFAQKYPPKLAGFKIHLKVIQKLN